MTDEREIYARGMKLRAELRRLRAYDLRDRAIAAARAARRKNQ